MKTIDASGAMRRCLLVLAGAGAGAGLGLLGGCAAVVPREFTTTEREMQQALEQRFPMQQRVLGIFDVQLTAPRVLLQPQAGRLMLGFDLAAREAALTQRDLRGRIMFSSALRYEPSDGTIRLDRVRRENIAIEGLPAALASGLNRVGGWLAESQLDDLVVYRVDRLALEAAARIGLQPGAIEVRPTGVTLRLVPVPSTLQRAS
ncbi:MAG: hypothetical protein RL654_1411 [Pseudomonadota bacterium]|jgi:hypothetical protein